MSRMTSWIVAQTKPRAEAKVARLLGQKMIPIFLPRLLVRHRHGSRRWSALEPLFPGYLFVQVRDMPEDIARIRWISGLRRLLGMEEDGIPTAVSDEVITFLQERSGEGGFIEPAPALTPGARVRFTHGPLALVEGIIERPASRADRVRVLLQVMHASVAVDVAIDELELIATA